MGHTFFAKCNDCRYGVEVKEGIGMLFARRNVFNRKDFKRGRKTFLESLTKDFFITIKTFNLMEDGMHPSNDYGYEMYHCPKCHHLESRFFFSMTGRGEQYTPKYRCALCNTLQERTLPNNWYYAFKGLKKEEGFTLFVRSDNRQINWICPYCGGRKLIFDNSKYAMWWD
ncbi:MAG: hypothetical protein FWF06_02335 [Symbiobacteriaceae bacterium]|nr:hypothetical protein [Symbiobacteriaceae bacterium]